FTFSYRGLENTLPGPYNAGNIGAQYWSAAWLPNNAVIGSAAAVLAGVGTVTANAVPMAATTFTPMVLSSVLAPLPIELTRFEGTCNGNGAFIHWTTATETNSDYFTLQRSDDGISFRTIGTIQAAGTSSSTRNYSYADVEPLHTTTYYRLLETDIQGNSKTASVITVEPCSDKIETIQAWSAGNNVTILVNTSLEQDYVVDIYDNRGRIVYTKQAHAQTGANRLDLDALDLAPSVYFVNVRGTTMQLAEKLYITRD
ncbi:MAG: T9SS type A sorting domain-containing protein, partial [Bacteroidia bacterium]